MKRTALLLLLILSSGCTNYLYSACSFYTEDNVKTPMLLYWNTTSYLFSDNKKKGVVTLSTLLGDRMQFQSLGSAYKWFESPENFVLADGPGIATEGAEVDVSTLFCGEVKGIDDVQDKKSNRVQVFLYCNKLSDAFSPARGVPASATPYLFSISSTERLSLFGGEISPPRTSDCMH